MFRALGVCGMEWGMVGVAAMEERMLENWKGMHGKGICVVCCVVVNGMNCMNALHGFIGREWMGEHVNGS